MKIKKLNELISVHGVGPKTLKDIKRIYRSIRQLRYALKKDKVPLRDDVCLNLKKALR